VSILCINFFLFIYSVLAIVLSVLQYAASVYPFWDLQNVPVVHICQTIYIYIDIVHNPVENYYV
jgi:hypothetical protein